jgi:hypothetical protein
MYHQLETMTTSGVVGDVVSYRQIFLGEQRRELLVFITDYYERDGEISRMLELLAALRHEIIVFHVMGGNEFSVDYGGYSQVEDLETGERVPVGKVAASGFDAYSARLAEWLASVRMQCLDRQIEYQLVRMDEPMDAALRRYLKGRMGAGLL